MITVIIPIYNANETLKECLEAIFKNNHKNFEVIVVDDRSTDDSIQIAKNYNCKIVELNENKGPAYARNVGAKSANGEILLFIDSDVVIKKDALMNIDQLFNNNKENVVQGIYSHEPDYESISTQYLQSYFCYYSWSNDENYTDTLTSCYFAITKKIFIESEGFNTSIKKATAEDEEFGYKLVDKGYKIFISRKLSGYHRVNNTLLKFIKRNFYMYTDTIKMFLRNKTYLKKIKQKRYSNTLIGLGILGFIILLIPVIFFYPSATNFNAFFVLNFIFLLLHIKFVNFVRREKNIFIASKIILICYLDTLLMLLGTIYGAIIYFLGKKY
jgi:glycosyltransferase involved in cell wall biosynthesis